MVKGIRIRNIEEAAYWLHYCWQFREKLHGSQFRTVRRLLIGSAEDGHSISVMEKVADNFVRLLVKDTPFEQVLAELLRICKVPNWWHPDSGGHDYIYSGMLASRVTCYDQQHYSPEQCTNHLGRAIAEQDKVQALFWLIKAQELGRSYGLPLAHKLHEIAQSINHASAKRLMLNIHLRHQRALSDDNNFMCQAAWLLCGGDCPVIDHIELVTRGEVRELMDKVHATEPHTIPEWCCDGIHCAGNDVRYTGLWERMYAVCQQYNHYKRIKPEDSWLEDKFYSLDGL